MKEKISVIIPTYNGADKICRLLNSLQQQTIAPDEVIVVIDGSTDNTLERVSTYQGKFNLLNIIVQQNRGRAVVRNRGAAEALGDIFIFYDDDMIAREASVQSHAEFHRANYGILSGNQMELVEHSKTDIQNYKAHLSEKWTSKFDKGISRLTMDNLFFTAANCSMRKEVFKKLYGFDERLTDAEDYDLACRAIEEGLDVFFDKSNEAIHVDLITCKSYIRRLRAYARAHNVLNSLHPHRLSEKDVRRPSILKKIVYRIAASSLWARIIDQEKVIRFFPTRLRYRFYDVVIQALAIEYPNVPL